MIPTSRRLMRATLAVASFVTLLATLPGCGSTEPPPAIEPQTGAPVSDTVATPAGARKKISIVFLGDSLTAGYGLLAQQSFPTLIQQMFAAEGYGEVETINAGISGDTTAGGLRRAEALLDANAKILVLGLGGNDALRGLTVKQTHDNLAAIIEMADARGVSVMLAGMEAPTNLGEDYQTAYHNAFASLAHDYAKSIVYVPFLLEGVAGNPALNQNDGIHPTAEGARVIAENLYPKLRTMVDAIGAPGQ